MSSALLSLLRAIDHWPSADDDRGSGAASLPVSSAAVHITDGATARDCHPSDVHLCPRMVDAAMHSGAAAQGTGGAGQEAGPYPRPFPSSSAALHVEHVRTLGCFMD